MSVFANSGQICIAGSRLFVERSIHDEFVERLAAYAEGLRIGDGIDPATEIGPLVSQRQLRTRHRLSRSRHGRGRHPGHRRRAP